MSSKRAGKFTAAGVLVVLAALPSAGQSAGKQKAAPEPVVVKQITALEASAMREAALNRIEELSKSTEAQVRANAVEAAGQSPKRLKSIIEAGLSDPNLGVRTVACVVVGKQKLTPLAERAAALTSDNSEYVRAGALFAMKKCGLTVDITPMSAFLLDNSNPKIRAHAAYLLGELGEKSAVPMLRQAASVAIPRASEIEVRLMQLQAGEAMVKLGDESGMESILAALYAARPEELEASVLAAQILGNLKDKSAAKLLVRTAEFVDPADGKSRQPAELRLAAVASLAQLGFRGKGVMTAQEYVSDPNPAIRAQAAFALGEIGGSEALGLLETLLNDPSAVVQLTAANAVLKAAR